MASHPVGEISFLDCVQGYVHVPTHHWSVLLLFHTGKKNHSSTILQSAYSYKHQIENSLPPHFFFLFAAASVLAACDLEIKKKQINSRQSSGTEFPLFLCREMLCWGSEREEMVRGWWKQRRRETESNNYSVKTFVFSERGQFSSWEHLSSSAPTVAPLWMCSTVPQDVGFRKPFFLQGGRPLPCLLCLQRQEGVGSASSLSQERSAIWEVSTWGQGMTSVTLYRPNPSDLEHSHARCFFQLCYLAFFMNLYEKAAEAVLIVALWAKC